MSAPTPTIDELRRERDLRLARAHEMRAESYTWNARAADIEADIRAREGRAELVPNARRIADDLRETAQTYRDLAMRCRDRATRRPERSEPA